MTPAAPRPWLLRHPGGMTAQVGALGGALQRLGMPDGAGGTVDVVLGLPEDDAREIHADHFLGVVIGRVANRIGGASFELEGRRVRLAANEGPNHLHGGSERAFDRVVWDGEQTGDHAVTLTRTSPDGEEGDPGTVEVRVTYELLEDGLAIRFAADVDAVTPLSLTSHAYWNLAGGGDVLDHVLTVDADAVVEVDDAGIPTGRLLDVAGTPSDLRDGVRLGDAVAALRDTAAGGLDHALVLRGGHGRLREVVRLHDPASGRTLALSSDQPSLQVYTGNKLAGVPGRDGTPLPAHAGVCLEPQGLPDAVNQPTFPSVLVGPDRPYVHELVVHLLSPGSPSARPAA